MQPVTAGLAQIRRVGQHAALYTGLRQQQLDQWLTHQLGEYHCDGDLAAGQFQFSSPAGTIHARMHLIASLAMDPATLVWGWAEMFQDRVGENPLSAQLRDFGAHQGLETFQTPELSYSYQPGRQLEAVGQLAHDVGAAAVEVFGPRGFYYTVPTGGVGSRLVVLLEQLSAPVPDLGLAEIIAGLPGLLAHTEDIGWSLDGLVRMMPGWQGQLIHQGPGTRVWRLLTPHRTGCDVVTSWDGQGRLSGLQVMGF